MSSECFRGSQPKQRETYAARTPDFVMRPEGAHEGPCGVGWTVHGQCGPTHFAVHSCHLWPVAHLLERAKGFGIELQGCFSVALSERDLGEPTEGQVYGYRDAGVSGRGVRSGVTEGNWEELGDVIYRGRGG